MILLAILTIWLVLITFAVVLCRVAATADERHDAATQRYPTISAKRLRGGDASRLSAVWEEHSSAQAAAQQERAGGSGSERAGSGSVSSSRDRDGRGHAGRYAA